MITFHKKLLSNQYNNNRSLYIYEFIAIGFVLKIQNPENRFRTY
jgi:hypothetical protein